MSPRLGSLPAELLLQIVDHIDEKPDLVDLAATSKTFNELVNPYIYASYINIHDGDDTRSSPANISFKTFLRTIIQRPDLALHVKTFEIRPFITKNLALEGWDVEGMSVEDATLLKKAASVANIIDTGLEASLTSDKLDNSHDADFVESIEKGYEDALVILLLAHLPRLEKITFRGMPEKANISLLWNDYLTRINHRFTHLTEVISVGFDRAISWEIGESSFFFRLPSLRTYTGEMVVHGDNVAGWNCTPGTSSVTSLHLPRCGLSLNALETLVSSCKALEHLEYSDGRNDWWEPDRPFEASQLAEALISQKDSLKSLNLCLSDLWAGHSLNFSCIAPLKEFTRLSRIHIDYNLLSRPSSGHELYDILPASLEDLSVNDPLDLEPLARLATDGRRSCPRLKQVHIGHTTRPLHVLSRSYRDHRQIPGFADMKTAFDNAGIAFDSFLSDDFRGSLHALEAFPDSDDETESFELGDNPFYDSDDPNDFPGFDDIDDYNDAYGGY